MDFSFRGPSKFNLIKPIEGGLVRGMEYLGRIGGEEGIGRKEGGSQEKRTRFYQ
jgi:hypothetical protein